MAFIDQNKVLNNFYAPQIIQPSTIQIQPIKIVYQSPIKSIVYNDLKNTLQPTFKNQNVHALKNSSPSNQDRFKQLQFYTERARLSPINREKTLVTEEHQSYQEVIEKIDQIQKPNTYRPVENKKQILEADFLQNEELNLSQEQQKELQNNREISYKQNQQLKNILQQKINHLEKLNQMLSNQMKTQSNELLNQKSQNLVLESKVAVIKEEIRIEHKDRIELQENQNQQIEKMNLELQVLLQQKNIQQAITLNNEIDDVKQAFPLYQQ